MSDVRFTPVFLGVENRAPVDLQSAAAIPMVVRGLGRSPWTNGSRGLADAVARAAAGELEWREPLWEGAFRMEVVFLTAEGQITPNPPLLAGFASSPPLPPGWYPVDPAGLRGLVVAVAVLDKETLSLALSIDPGIMQRLADSLPSVSADNITPVQSWSFDMFPGDIPEPIRQHVRFFERTYYLSGVPAL